jgi:hypothetical protein
MQLFDDELRNLLIQRLIERKNRGALTGIYQLDADTGRQKYFSPDDLINEAMSGSTAGNEILLAEKRFHDELKRRI